MTLCERSVKASKKLVGTLAKSAKKGKFSLQKTFTQSEMKEILSSKSNDNIFSLNDNNVYMSRGKIAVGESIGSGRVSSSVSTSIEAKILSSTGSDARMSTRKSVGNRSRRSVVVETKGGEEAVLTEYLRPGGGHHIHMKSAYKSHPSYDLNKALCLSKEEMTRLGLDHVEMTKVQRKLYTELARSGKELTREESNRIAVEALIAGGASRQLARDMVASATWDLKLQGVRAPTDMPWGKR